MTPGWPEATPVSSAVVVERIASAVARGARTGPLVLLSDFDGTLCGFSSDPDGVWLAEPRRRLLSALACRPDVTVGIVSGRRLADVRERTRLEGPVFYAGLHGLEIEGPDVDFVHERVAETRGLLQVLARALRAHLSDAAGVLIEDKALSVAVHTRQAPQEEAARAEALLARLVGPHLESGALRLLRGSCVAEVLPNIPWTKGDAVSWIRRTVEARAGRPAWPVYLGDDVTDEDAFRAIGDRGVTIVVGERPSQAAHRLPDPDAVEALLDRLANVLP